MKLFKCLSVAVLVTALAACGGGGGSSGTTASSDTSSGNSATGDQQTTTTASMFIDVFGGAGNSTNSISAIEISKVQIILKDAAGRVVPGVVVTFAETGAGLLSFAPASSTALTDEKGVASVEIRAASTSSVGATTVNASASVSGGSISAQKAIAITNAPTNGTIVPDPQALANALNFLDVNPADKAIVIQGAGGNGRSESASLRFRIVDKNNTPVQGVKTTFVAVPSDDVTLNITDAKSDAEGVVVTTVSSKSKATAVVIRATVTRTDTSTIISQSDQLVVTTGVATQAGFDLSASKYNLNFGLTGDKSEITVRIRDANGNPVADGVPVVFTANFGAVGFSSRGGCITLGGLCKVDYIVQNPRPIDGQLALVTASTQVGDGTSISDVLAFNFVNPSLLNLFDNSLGGTKIEEINFPSGVCGKRTFSFFAGTPENFPAPAGTTVTVNPITSDLGISLKSGSPILDQISLSPFRTTIDIEIDLSKMVSPKSCDISGLVVNTAVFDVKFLADSLTTTRRITVNYFGIQ